MRKVIAKIMVIIMVLIIIVEVPVIMAIVLKIITTMIMIILILFIVWYYSSFKQPRPEWDAYSTWNLSDFSDFFLVPTYFPGWREAMWKL